LSELNVSTLKLSERFIFYKTRLGLERWSLVVRPAADLAAAAARANDEEFWSKMTPFYMDFDDCSNCLPEYLNLGITLA
jgi:hypothetical protein